jgi:UDP-N-acetylmuramoyl-tripeptide--D-alanyl-D-alanine ligase
LSEPVPVNIHELGDHMLRPAMAAAATAIKLGMSKEEVVKGLAKVQAVPGRMNVLRGVENTTIIDDSYNSSPLALEYSLRTLYQINAPQKIAVLGDMNELGETSAAEHEKAGSLCDLNELAWVVTVGGEAEKYLAPAAKIKGCQVRSFPDAISAGTFVKSVLTNGAVILFKGSQGGIYLEEAIKIILHSTSDEAYLVRQSPEWIKRKNDFFSKLS